MSTKIYNGWRLAGTDMVSLRRRLAKLRSRVYEKAAATIADWAANTALGYIDRFTLLGRKLVLVESDASRHTTRDLSIATYVAWTVREGVCDSYRSLSRTSFDLACSVVAIPMIWKRQETTLLLFYDNSPGSIYKDDFVREIGAEEFYYWDNADMPEGMSEKDWEERRKIWDAAIGSDPPAERGFAFECMTEYRVPMVIRDAVFSAAKSVPMRTRVEKVALAYVLEREIRRRKKAGETIDSLSAVYSELRTPSKQRLIAKVSKWAKTKLKPVTREMFEAPMSSIIKKPGKSGQTGSS